MEPFVPGDGSELQIMGPETGHLAVRCHSLTMGTLRPREEHPSVGSKGQARVLPTREGPGWASLPSPGLFVPCGWEGRGLVEPGQWGGVRWVLGVGVKAHIQGLPAPDLCLSGSRVTGVQRPGLGLRGQGPEGPTAPAAAAPGFCLLCSLTATGQEAEAGRGEGRCGGRRPPAGTGIHSKFSALVANARLMTPKGLSGTPRAGC